MKKSIAILLFVLFGATACSQYTCPTYADASIDQKQEQVIEDKENI